MYIDELDPKIYLPEKLLTTFRAGARVNTDSRTIKPGEIFIALKGERFDGNNFVESCLANGAALAVTERNEPERPDNIVVVPDTLRTLQLLALWYRKQLKTTVIAVTGSNGKTTTKELLNAVLSAKYRVAATSGNLNNQIGVPLTLLSVPRDADYAIIEMGTNMKGEIALLSSIAAPDYGVITNIGKAHLSGFGDEAGVFEEKTALYRWLDKNGGKIFLNAADKLLASAAKGIGTVSYAVGYPADYRGTLIRSFPAVEISYTFKGNEYRIQSRMPGAYNAQNIMCAVAAGLHFGTEPKDIVQALENYSPSNQRSQWIKTEKNNVVMDAYNANPSSMTAAITEFASSGITGKVMILGDMFELGEASAAEHKRIAQLALGSGIEKVIFVGPEFLKAVKPGVTAFSTNEECIRYLEQHSLEGKTIWVKGSRGMRLEELLPLL
ncbi:MAG: UDP-N-acetylmuramoyl-tripeptide--D-alanyl-D-alanine ligase [Bacteroidales bacterium]